MKRQLLAAGAALVFAQNALAAGFFETNRLRNSTDHVTPWDSQKWAGVTKQTLDNSCGAAAVATYVSNFKSRLTTEGEVLAHVLKVKKASELAREGMSAFNIVEYLRSAGLAAKVLALNDKALFLYLRKKPMIVLLTNDEGSHFTVVRSIDDKAETARLLDSELGNVNMPLAELVALFTNARRQRSNASLEGYAIDVD